MCEVARPRSSRSKRELDYAPHPTCEVLQSPGNNQHLTELEALQPPKPKQLRLLLEKHNPLRLPHHASLGESSGMKELLCEFRSACVEHCDDSQKQ